MAFAISWEKYNEESTTGFYPYRTDDRGRDYRYSGCQALPAYQSYVVKAKMSEAILATSQCCTTISEVYQTADSTTPSTIGSDGWGCGEGSGDGNGITKYVASIHTTGSGVIEVKTQGFNDTDVDSEVIKLVPFSDSTTAMTTGDAGKQIFSSSVSLPENTTMSQIVYSCKG